MVLYGRWRGGIYHSPDPWPADDFRLPDVPFSLSASPPAQSAMSSVPTLSPAHQRECMCSHNLHLLQWKERVEGNWNHVYI